MNENRVYIGVDAGGTKTAVILVRREPHVRVEVRAGPANVATVGVEACARTLRSAVDEAREQAGVSWNEVECLCAAVAGASASGLRDALHERLGDGCRPAQVLVVADVSAAYAGLLAWAWNQPGPDGTLWWQKTDGAFLGAAVIAGTGSSALAIANNGRWARCGGYGRTFSDEGSGHWVVREAITAALRAHDGREPTTRLAEVLAREFGCEGVLGLARLDVEPARLASAFPAVLALAVDDPVAHRILVRAGEELGALAAAAVRGAGPQDGGRVWVVGGGSVLRAHGPHRDAFLRVVQPWMSSGLEPMTGDPLIGALEMALHHDDPTQPWQVLRAV
jgi:N-acetylglucosamine kinase-like BadF-type ATPase